MDGKKNEVGPSFSPWDPNGDKFVILVSWSSCDLRCCLQDLHWYAGSWGYFPTYTLGAMTAAQLFQAARQAVPEIPAALARGDFRPLLGWLRTHVHGLGSRLTARELLTRATGRPQ